MNLQQGDKGIGWIPYSYIAGFFDGEGSAMILTVRRKKEKNIYRFRPVIKIAQLTTPILYGIKDRLGFGTVITGNKTPCLQINGHKKILKFIELVGPYVILKRRQLLLLKELIALQHSKHWPYARAEIEKMIDIRDRVHRLNAETRSSVKLKYSKAEIMKEHRFS